MMEKKTMTGKRTTTGTTTTMSMMDGPAPTPTAVSGPHVLQTMTTWELGG